mgnify:CR=1 FL=1
MAAPLAVDSKAYQEALKIGRPPNIVKLFPESQALIVSGKYIDKAMLAKGKAIAMAANGRSYFVIRGALLAAQQANACLIIEIARSEGGANAYCAVNYWNIARQVNAACNELGITIPVAMVFMLAPGDCSPSLNVVSNMITRSFIFLLPCNSLNG